MSEWVGKGEIAVGEGRARVGVLRVGWIERREV